MHPTPAGRGKGSEGRRDVEAQAEAGIPVFLGTPDTVEGAVQMLRNLAARVEAPLGQEVLVPIERVVERLKGWSVTPRRVFVPIWEGPYMSLGSDTYMHDVLKMSGGENACGGAARYPTVTRQEIEELRSEVVLLPDEPYLLAAEDLSEFYGLDIPAAKEDRLHLEDGKLLTWYGPRMASSLTQVFALLRS